MAVAGTTRRRRCDIQHERGDAIESRRRRWLTAMRTGWCREAAKEEFRVAERTMSRKFRPIGSREEEDKDRSTETAGAAVVRPIGGGEGPR